MPSSVTINAGTRRLKIAVMGSEGVGKTSIIRGIVSDPIAKLASICNTDTGLSYHVNIGNISMGITEVSLSTVDNISPLLDLNPAVQTSDAFILVYAVDNLPSFDYLETLKDAIVQSRSSDVPIIVVGHKTDSIRCGIAYEVVDCLVSIDWEMYYTETSAKTDDSVRTILPSLFHHRKLCHYKFPSEIKAEYGPLQRRVSRRKTTTFSVNKVNREPDNKRVRAQSESWNQKSNKEKRKRDVIVDETEIDVFGSMNDINENRRESVESMTFKSLLTDRIQNKTADIPWRPSSLANLLKTAKPRTLSFSFFSDILSPGCSNSNSSCSSPCDSTFTSPFPSDLSSGCSSPSDKISSGNSSASAASASDSSVFKFIYEMKNRSSSASSHINSKPDDDFIPEESRLLSNGRISHSGSMKSESVLDENRNDWVSSVIQFLKK